MNLRDQAAADLIAILEDSGGGFGWPITIRDPDGREAKLTGFSNDIGNMIDPETGIAVAGRSASVAISLKRLDECDLEDPRNIADGSLKPWLVFFEGIPHAEGLCTFKVSHSMPDRTIGVVVCLLEAYREAI